MHSLFGFISSTWSLPNWLIINSVNAIVKNCSEFLQIWNQEKIPSKYSQVNANMHEIGN